MKLFANILVISLAASYGSSQDSNSPLALQVQAPMVGAKSTALPVVCSNVSGKPIAAYVLIVDSLDASGNRVFREVHTGMPGLNPKRPDSAKAAGQVWTESIKLASLSQPVARRAVTLDYVLFANSGGDWGPDTLKYSLKIAGFKAGLAMSQAK